MKPRLGQIAQSGATDGQVATWDNAAGEWVPDSPAPATALVINTQTVNAYTLVLADAGALVRMNVATISNIVTLPPNSAVAYPVGTFGQIEQAGTGQTKFAAGAGVTIDSPAAMLSIAAQFGRVVWVYLGSNVYGLEGRMAP